MQMKNLLLLSVTLYCHVLSAQVPVNLSGLQKNGATVRVSKNLVTINWPAGAAGPGKMVLDLNSNAPLFQSIHAGKANVAAGIDPVFILRTGKRTLSPNSGGWNVFFDNVYKRPYTTELVAFTKGSAAISSAGSRTVVKIGKVSTPLFSGHLEITLYNGSPLFNVAAVLSTQQDSTAILYDAGLVNNSNSWQQIAWADVKGNMQYAPANLQQQSQHLEVRYRAVIGENNAGSLAVFPAPHQYFYPLDEAFNLRFTWFGANYLNLVPGFAIGIRQDPEGDHRYVPWFNAPPGTLQRLNFFCLISAGKAPAALDAVKQFTHNYSYAPLPGYKTMASHFHNEFITKVALSGQPVPEKPEFAEVLKKAGLNIVKLAEFHGPGHPKGPDSLRLKELESLFTQTKRLSDTGFLLLPGEEANNFYGGHWLAFFPRPVYWVMSRKGEEPYVSQHPQYGKVYHIGNKQEMLRLLEQENGLAWVAHARTKSSTGYPDKYKDEPFFHSPTYLGAAWKAIPADLSWQTLSPRVLHLMDDMANWGLKKYALAESDIFTITEQNEMYAHLNVNYLKMDKLPQYENGWQSVLDALRHGQFFVSTGEVLIPSFTVNGKESGEILRLDGAGKATVAMQLRWTFPMNYAEIVSGDGQQVYRQRIDLTNTQAFGEQPFRWPVNLAGRKWVRVEAWDVAANGAFTQMVWLE